MQRANSSPRVICLPSGSTSATCSPIRLPVPPAVRIEAIDGTGGQRRLRVRIEDDNLRYVALFQNDEKIDLKPVADLTAEGGARIYAPTIDLAPALDTLRVVAADADEVVEGQLLRLWGDGLTSAKAADPTATPTTQP